MLVLALVGPLACTGSAPEPLSVDSAAPDPSPPRKTTTCQGTAVDPLDGSSQATTCVGDEICAHRSSISGTVGYCVTPCPPGTEVSPAGVGGCSRGKLCVEASDGTWGCQSRDEPRAGDVR